MTAYYDPILDVHQRLPVTFAMTYCFYLAPQVPAEARRLFDAAAGSAGISREGVTNVEAYRINAIAWFLAREWGERELEATLRETLDAHYEPTWDRSRGEFTWGLGLGEAHPRGQYNGFLAAAEAGSPGAWARLSAAPLALQPGLVEGVDFPKVALAEARWEGGALHLRLDPQNDDVVGEPTRFRVTGLAGGADPAGWRLEGEGQLRTHENDLVIETTIRSGRLVLESTADPS